MRLPMAQQEAHRTQAKACNPPHVSLGMGGDAGGHQVAGAAGTPWACGAVAAGVVALGLAGAGVLVWWAVAFHPADEQLWMVPVGLILLGTPFVAWLSIFASGACRRLDRLRAVLSEPPPSSLAVTAER